VSARLPFPLFPRSLAGQLIALLLGAVVLGQMVTTLLLVDERRSAIQSANREQILSRTASLVRLIEETPPEIHDRILSTASSRSLIFTVDAAPDVTRGPQSPPERGVVKLMQESLGADREVRSAIEVDPEPQRVEREVERREREAERRERDAERRERRGEAREREAKPRGPDGDERRRRPEFHHDRVSLTARLSVRLESGAWLNAFARFGPPPAWAWPTLLSSATIAVAIVAIVILTVRRITRPLRALALAADRLGRGETTGPLPETGPLEIRRTTHAFNAMEQRLGRFVADRTRLLAAISHDLRTPLTALRLRAEFVEDDEIRDKLVETIDEMHRMTEATLAFAREDVSHEPARRVDLAALVAALGDDFSDMGEKVTVAVPERLGFTVKPTALRRALRNLIENALRYGGGAAVSLEVRPAEVVIAVEDEGPGIPPERMEDVFEPFVRLETSRSQETGGVGLGLATARSIVHAHGGEIHLANRPSGGLRAEIRLPRPAA